MSKEKFVFEWKVGDEVICPRRWVGDITSLDGLKAALKGCKPYGETKIRYKAEKLAWQQSRMKEGDWVKRVAGSLNPNEVFKKGCKFKIARASESLVHQEVSGVTYYHARENLKPCKPPKEKVNPVKALTMIRVESENFRIENDELVFTGSSMGERAWGSIFTQHDGEICLKTFDGMKMSSKFCKEVGTLLDLYAAMVK